LRETALAPLNNLKLADKFDVTIKVVGGGIHAQAEAVRHGLARALVLSDAGLKKRLRGLGFLTRDPRMVERKKYGLKKARRAPQWQKR
jgi:small subunit ribosomal protein S9